MAYISCFSDFAFYFYYYFMENCHTWIIISMWQNDLHTNTSRSVWPILYGLMIKMLQYKMYPAGELAVLRQLLFIYKSSWCFLQSFQSIVLSIQETKFKIYFQHGSYGNHLGFLFRTILIVFSLPVRSTRRAIVVTPVVCVCVCVCVPVPVTLR